MVEVLKAALIRSGIDQGTIDVLMGKAPIVQGHSGHEIMAPAADINSDSGHFKKEFHADAPVPFVPVAQPAMIIHGKHPSHHAAPEGDKNLEMKTLRVSGLSGQTTLKDVLSILRSGRVSEAYIREEDHTAVITLLEGAQVFLDHTKRHGLILNGKKVIRPCIRIGPSW
jgi:hypothetical protein